jgi:protein ImuB
MLWTCLHFPDLPLRIFARAGMREVPSVVSTASHRPDVLVANGAAQKRGIVSGMSIAGALGLDPDIAIHLRDERAEAAALKNIALWAGQWTSTIAIESPANVLLEISGCLNYFGGLSTLLGRIDAGLAAIGFSAVVATAPTASAASLLARAGQSIAIEDEASVRAGVAASEKGAASHPRENITLRHPRESGDPVAFVQKTPDSHFIDSSLVVRERGKDTDIDSALASLPVGLLDGADKLMDTLWGIGVRTLGDVLALPRDGFARRFGANLLDQIDRARGNLPDARALFVAPERYHGQLELPAPVHETEALLFAVRRLVVELAGFLNGRGAGVTRMRFDLVHEDVPPTSIVIGLAATRQIEHMQNVLRERLGQLQLPDRVEAIRLVSEETAPLDGKEGELFQGAGKDVEAGTQLVERLRARLGEGAVHALALHADHRPERAQATSQGTQAGTQAMSMGAWATTQAVKGNAQATRANVGTSSTKGSMSKDERTQRSSPVRPLWLFAEPRLLGTEPASAEVKLLSGPERIESGWWDDHEVGRDYFIGRDAQGAEVWLYRDRGGQWFMQGVFA